MPWVAPRDVDVNVVEAIAVNIIRQTEELEIRSIEASPEEVELMLGDRQRVHDADAEIRSQVRGVVRRV